MHTRRNPETISFVALTMRSAEHAAIRARDTASKKARLIYLNDTAALRALAKLCEEAQQAVEKRRLGLESTVGGESIVIRLAEGYSPL